MSTSTTDPDSMEREIRFLRERNAYLERHVREQARELYEIIQRRNLPAIATDATGASGESPRNLSGEPILVLGA